MSEQKIKVSEQFFSIQGEGMYAGVPSIFLRVFYCNLRCKKYGMPAYTQLGKYNTEVEQVIKNIDQYKKYEDLPLVKTGCDTYASIYPEFKHLSPDKTVKQIVDDLQVLLPNEKFEEGIHYIITGGEPLLMFQSVYPALFEEISKRKMDFRYLTFETNGTKPISPVLRDYLNSTNIETTFSVSSKLPSSGEPWNKAIIPSAVASYTEIHNRNIYFKWVCSSEDDWADVERAIETYAAAGLKFPVYLMPAGGERELYDKNKVWLADLCCKKGLRFSPRLQIDIWNNGWSR